jgi:hypothetical protein
MNMFFKILISVVVATATGSSATFDNGDGSFSSFYQNVGFRSDAPLDAFGYILSNPEQLGKQLSSGGNLPDFAKTELLKASIHAGQEEFASHPVTKATVNAATSIASGAIEGVMALGSLGAGLFTKAAVKGGGKLAVQFGKTENQIYHAFRHTDALGLDRSLVQSTIQNHFKTVSSQVVPGKPFNQIIKIGSQRIQYTVFKLPDGTFNIGRIHGVK